MDIGTSVKIDIPYKIGEPRHGNRYRYGRILKKYPNFYLVEIQKEGEGIYKEAFKENELIINKE